MAFDKLCDSTVLNSGLTQIANAIREKAGISDALAFPTGMAEAIAAIEAGGGATLWDGGKFTMGSFVLSEDTTTEYVIATSSDAAMRELLNDGETSFPHNGSELGLLVLMKPMSSFSGSSYKQGVFGAIFFPVQYGSGAQCSGCTFYIDNYGSNTAENSNILKVQYNKMAIGFKSSRIGKAGLTYNWLAWRSVK